MKSTMGYGEYSQLRIEDYLREDRPEAEGSVKVYSNPTMLEKEGDGARVDNGIQLGGNCKDRAEDDVLEQIPAPNNLNVAYKKVKANKGSHGVDGMTVDQLSAYLAVHGEELRKSILNGTYKPQPVRRVEIPKPDGAGVRLLGVLTYCGR